MGDRDGPAYNWLTGEYREPDFDYEDANGERPANVFCGGPYDRIGEGCYRRQPTSGDE